MRRVWAVVPAAGVGRRMEADRPKQYLQLGKLPIIEHTLFRLLSYGVIEQIVVAISPEDVYWPETQARLNSDRVQTAVGGSERCHSVLNGLKYLEGKAYPEDWVLVHDAARPCIRLDDLRSLMNQIKEHPAGGLLASPLSDTLKRADKENHVLETVPRESLWRALTPQVFRYAPLKKALEQAFEQGVMVTDESMAMEMAGYRPLLVEGSPDNIKITRPEDLALAKLFLQQQERHV